MVRTVLIAALLALAAGAGSASSPAKPSSAAEYRYHARIPLGSESFSVQPWKSRLTVLVSAENPDFEGWSVITHGDRRRLLDTAGEPVRFYPDEVTFRVTLGTRTPLAEVEPFPLRASLPTDDYLLKVRFQVKIFHGLRATVVRPASVTLIGVPADIAYDERIYRVAFDLDDVPIHDRVVLEVLAPSGERLCKFHLDLS